MSDLLRAFFADQMPGYTEEIFNEIAIHFSLKIAKRNEILTRADYHSRYLYFVNKGGLRTYYLGKDANEITEDLAFEGDLSRKAVKRYQWLKKNKPEIFERVSDKHIASYLGMSSRTLIRAKAGTN